MRPLRRGARLMRRVGSKWTQVGRFGSIAEAQQALDEQVGEGHGDAREYLVVVPSSRFHTITKVVLIAALSAGIALVVSFIVQ